MNKKLSLKAFIFSQAGILIIGLLFLGGLYYFLNKDFQKLTLNNYQPVTSKPLSFNLEVNNPEDELLTFEKTVVVSGKTSPNATVLISNNNSGDIGIEASDKGEFSTVITLIPNVNNLQVTAIDEFGNTDTQSRAVFYSEEKLQ